MKFPEEIAFKDIKSAVSKIGKSEEIELEEKQLNDKTELEAKQILINLEGQRQFLHLQKGWARDIKWQIWAVLAFQMLFVLLVGFDPWHFTENINKLPYMYVGVILETLANIVALGFVVARFLFPQVPTPSK